MSLLEHYASHAEPPSLYQPFSTLVTVGAFIGVAGEVAAVNVAQPRFLADSPGPLQGIHIGRLYLLHLVRWVEGTEMPGGVLPHVLKEVGNLSELFL
jgi:hypothetical protein